MKGLESSTGDRLTQIFRQEMGYSNQVAIWVGPGHVQDYYAGRPSCMIVGCEDFEVTKYLVSELNSNLIRLYYSQDLIGCEIGVSNKDRGISDTFCNQHHPPPPNKMLANLRDTHSKSVGHPRNPNYYTTIFLDTINLERIVKVIGLQG